MKRFKLHIKREAKEATEWSPEVKADEKDIVNIAPSCAEAVALTCKQYPDYLAVSWEEVLPEIQENAERHVKLDQSSFRSEAEWKSAQMDMDEMSFDEGMALVEKRKWKVVRDVVSKLQQH